MRDKRLDNLALRLRELRGTRTLYKVSRDIGVSQQCLGYYELGKRVPGTDILLILADYYNVSPNYLLGAENQRGDTNAEREKVKMFLALANEIAKGGIYEL